VLAEGFSPCGRNGKLWFEGSGLVTNFRHSKLYS